MSAVVVASRGGEFDSAGRAKVLEEGVHERRREGRHDEFTLT
jgi:hypothetical protein